MRHEYRVNEYRYSDDSGHFYVEIRKWYWPLWKKLKYYDYFAIAELADYEFKENSFKSFEAAKNFALEFSIKGRVAFIKNKIQKDPVYLGRLP